jgi:hypothetical protein
LLLLLLLRRHLIGSPPSPDLAQLPALVGGSAVAPLQQQLSDGLVQLSPLPLDVGVG